jgi:hypothetical protein
VFEVLQHPLSLAKDFLKFGLPFFFAQKHTCATEKNSYHNQTSLEKIPKKYFFNL